MDTHCSLQVSRVPHQICTSIEHRSHQLLIEVPEPWERVFGLSPHFPSDLLNALQIFAKLLPSTSTSVFASDTEYSDSKGLRLIYLRHNRTTLSYDRFESVFAPEELAGVVESIAREKEMPGHDGGITSRDFFVCAHAKRDHCCGAFGKDLYEALRTDHEIQKHGIRIFKASHIGGHRYAPTMLEVPTLNCWGQLTFESARDIVLRQGDMQSLMEHYRGSASLLSPYFQVAEKVLIQKYGWDWFSFAKKSFNGEIQADQSRVHVNFTRENSVEHYSFDIAALEPVMLRANCDEEEQSEFPQYRVLNIHGG